MVAEPSFFAVTTPLEDTVATVESLLDQLTFLFVAFAGATVTVRVSVASIAIVVEDSGPGVQKGEEGKIFNRFYSHRDDVQKLKHSGLGLSTVKAIAESMNGKINVSKSENLGGAMFVVVLPLSGNLDEITNL